MIESSDPTLPFSGERQHRIRDVEACQLSSHSQSEAAKSLKLKLSAAVFAVQVVVLLTLIIISIINLSTEHQNKELWVALLSTSLGILLPSPNIKGKQPAIP